MDGEILVNLDLIILRRSNILKKCISSSFLRLFCSNCPTLCRHLTIFLLLISFLSTCSLSLSIILFLLVRIAHAFEKRSESNFAPLLLPAHPHTHTHSIACGQQILSPKCASVRPDDLKPSRGERREKSGRGSAAGSFKLTNQFLSGRR